MMAGLLWDAEAGNLLENSVTSLLGLTRSGKSSGPFSRAALKSFNLVPVFPLISTDILTALSKNSATFSKSSSVKPLVVRLDSPYEYLRGSWQKRSGTVFLLVAMLKL